jgi:acyl-CoA hydrolase
MESTDRPRAVSESRVLMTEIVMPEDTNHFGDIFGGRVLALVDKAGAIAAIRHCRREVLTASIDSVDFLSPLKEGYILTLEAEVQAVFRTSMEIAVQVFGENPLTGTRTLTCTAFLTLVAIGEDGHPTKVPPLALETDEQRRRAAEAAERRNWRLSRTGRRSDPGGAGPAR